MTGPRVTESLCGAAQFYSPMTLSQFDSHGEESSYIDENLSRSLRDDKNLGQCLEQFSAFLE